MKSFIHFRNTTLFVNALIITCFRLVALTPNTFGVVPPPDGGYANFTTAEGTNALLNLTSGAGNTGVGWYSLFSAGPANNNTGVGAGTLALTTTGADDNTAVGSVAMFLNTGGHDNVAVGTAALLNNENGNWNSAIGAFALHDNIDGFNNNALGQAALFRNIHGTDNTAIGDSALLNNDITGNGDANFNTAVGSAALFFNTDGTSNTAVGYKALFSSTTAGENTAIGAGALEFNNAVSAVNTAIGSRALRLGATGTLNTATGFGALEFNAADGNTANGCNALSNNTDGDLNTAVGEFALLHNTMGSNNTAIGASALVNNTTGGNNVALGVSAGFNLDSGSNNIDIGSFVQGVAGESNTIRIGNANITDTYIAGISGATASGGIAVFVNGSGKLGTVTSSVRFKDQIKPMDKASEAILSLKPVTFRYKKELDPDGSPQFGLVAEEVEKVNPDLIVRDKNGKPYSVRYDQVNAMLLNEFLKAHKKVEEQQATITQLKKDLGATIAQLTTRLDDQAAQIQKVSAQLEVSKPASQTVLNNQ